VEKNAELLREIKNKMKTDLEIQDILKRLKKGE
jgi:redox-regulated HSP33 family molecular chaperone